MQDKSDTEKDDDQENTKKYPDNIVHSAMTLLFHWKRPPGLLDDGDYSGNELHTWLNLAKSICVESGHLDSAMDHAGRVLYYTPPDPNGLWINEEVAKTFNEENADRMRSGFCLEAVNSRGFHYLDPTGMPEYQLSEFWGKKASEIENKSYIRFASVLQEIALTYKNEAEQVISEHKKDENDAT